MRRVVTLAIVLLLVGTAAMASEDTWRVELMADSGAGMNHGPGVRMGEDPRSVDSLDDLDVVFDWFADTPGNTANIVSRIPGQSLMFDRDVRKPSAPPKAWDLYVAGNRNATYSEIRLVAKTVDTVLPPAQYQGIPVRYYLAMVDNKGIAGAPANGTRWDLPTPTTHSADPYWISPVNLPVIVLSASTPQAMFNEGYRLQFVQEAVPEPNSLLALGTGLLGLAGHALKRRRD